MPAKEEKKVEKKEEKGKDVKAGEKKKVKKQSIVVKKKVVVKKTKEEKDKKRKILTAYTKRNTNKKPRVDNSPLGRASAKLRKSLPAIQLNDDKGIVGTVNRISKLTFRERQAARNAARTTILRAGSMIVKKKVSRTAEEKARRAKELAAQKPQRKTDRKERKKKSKEEKKKVAKKVQKHRKLKKSLSPRARLFISASPSNYKKSLEAFAAKKRTILLAKLKEQRKVYIQRLERTKQRIAQLSSSDKTRNSVPQHERKKHLEEGVVALIQKRIQKIEAAIAGGAKKEEKKVDKKEAKKAAKAKHLSRARAIAQNARASLIKREKSFARAVSRTLKPGTVVIALTGPCSGRKMIYVKPGDGGQILCTGPYKANTVSLIRIHYKHVIPTSVRVAFSAGLQRIVANLHYDELFSNKTSIKKAKTNKLKSQARSKSLRDKAAWVAAVNLLNRRLYPLVKKTPFLLSYLRKPFTLRRGELPHELKF